MFIRSIICCEIGRIKKTICLPNFSAIIISAGNQILSIMRPYHCIKFIIAICRATVILIVMGYFADKMNASRAGLTTDAIVALLHSQDAGDEAVDRVSRLLSTCDVARYASGSITMETARAAALEASDVLRLLEGRKPS